MDAQAEPLEAGRLDVKEPKTLMVSQDFIELSDAEFTKLPANITVKVVGAHINEVAFQSVTLDGLAGQKVAKIKATVVYKFKNLQGRMVTKTTEVKVELKPPRRNKNHTEIERLDTMEVLAWVLVGGVPDGHPNLIERFVTANTGAVDQNIRHFVLQQLYIPARYLDSLVKITEKPDPNAIHDRSSFMTNNFDRTEVAHPPNAFAFYFMKNKLQMFFNTNEKEWTADKKNRYYEANFVDVLEIAACGISSNLHSEKQLDFYLTAASSDDVCFLEEIAQDTNYRRADGASFQVQTTSTPVNFLINPEQACKVFADKLSANDFNDLSAGIC